MDMQNKGFLLRWQACRRHTRTINILQENLLSRVQNSETHELMTWHFNNFCCSEYKRSHSFVAIMYHSDCIKYIVQTYTVMIFNRRSWAIANTEGDAVESEPCANCCLSAFSVPFVLREEPRISHTCIRIKYDASTACDYYFKTSLAVAWTQLVAGIQYRHKLAQLQSGTSCKN
jgi:hypothetical protein